MRLLCVVTLLLFLSSAAQHKDVSIPTSWSAEYYQKNSSGQYNSGIGFLSDYNLSNFAYILDIGCGTGEITAYVAQNVPLAQVIGVDAESGMIETARSAHGHIKNLEFQVQDAQKLNFKNQFDFVYSFGCLQWVKGRKKTKVFKGIAESMRVGGMLLIVAAARISTHPLFTAFQDAGKTNEWREILKNFDPNKEHYPLEKDVIEATLKNCGFRSFEVTETIRVRNYANKEELKSWMLTWISGFPTVAALSEQKKVELVKDVVDYYYKNVSVYDDGSVDFAFPTIIVKAIK